MKFKCELWTVIAISVLTIELNGQQIIARIREPIRTNDDLQRLNNLTFNKACKRFECVCENATIQCRTGNFRDVNPISNAPEDTWSVEFTGHSLNSLNRAIFTKPMPKLTRLDLSNNTLRSISNSSVFKNMPALRQLVLNLNRLKFDQMDEYSALGVVSSTLEYLSLRNALHYQRRHINTNDAIETDLALNRMFKLSRLTRLKTLKLAGNSLVSFNTDNNEDFDVDDSYEDILCLMPALEHLHLENNYLSTITFELRCVSSQFNLTSLHLESNLLINIDAKLLQIFRRFRKINDRFRVYLTGNYFKCDCSLMPFYQSLRAANQIVDDYQQLVCSHRESLNATFGRKIIDSRLDELCNVNVSSSSLDNEDDDDDESDDWPYLNKIDESGKRWEQRNSSSYFRNRTKTTTTTKDMRFAHLHHSNRLILFLFSSLVISGTIILILRFHCFKSIRLSNLNWYKSLLKGRNGDENREANFTARSVNGAPVGRHEPNLAHFIVSRPPTTTAATDDFDDIEVISEIPEEKASILKRAINKWTTFKSRRGRNNMLTDNDDDTNIDYERFEDADVAPNPNRSKSAHQLNFNKPVFQSIPFDKNARFSLTNVILNKRKKNTILKIKQVSSSDESDREEIFLDTTLANSDTAQNSRGDKVYLDISPKVSSR